MALILQTMKSMNAQF